LASATPAPRLIEAKHWFRAQDKIRPTASPLHAAGIRSLVAELADQEAPALAASEPVLEAAE
jgi:hypothetical protein